LEPNILYTHITAAAIFAYLLDHLQQWEKVPWINRETKKLNAWLRVALSGIATLGIHWTWSGTWSAGRQVMITIPALSVLAHTAFNWIGQYSIQYFGEQGLKVGTTFKLDPKAFNDLVEAMVEAVAQKLQGPKA
jgi:hypothetical protein